MTPIAQAHLIWIAKILTWTTDSIKRDWREKKTPRIHTIRAIADFEDGDRNANDRYFVSILLYERVVAESLSMNRVKSQRLAARINKAVGVKKTKAKRGK